MMLAATRPVLYRSTQYRAGDALPADNKAMVEAWLEAGSARWADEAAEAPKRERKKADAKPRKGKPAAKRAEKK